MSPSPAPWLRRLWHGALHLQRALLVLGAVLLTLLIFAQVVARYLFQTAIFGIEETAVYIAIWFYFLGGAVGADQREHISASLADVLVKNQTAQQAIKLFACLVSVLVCAWMVVWSWGLTQWSLSLGMMSTELNIPVGYIHLAMPVGLGLMTLYFFAELIEHGVELVRRLRTP
jgi:TRAP-type C4-dicarboxylate transport system permease small subunit